MHCINEVLKVSFTCIFVISSTRCDSVIKTIEEGEAQLHFPHPCDCAVTLQYGNRRPFYKSVDLEYNTLNDDQSERFALQKIAEGNCSLQLNISPVKRTDSGTYILLGCISDYIERVAFDVDFLPGPAHCHLGGIHNTGNWERLRCRAAIGSMRGQIQCYQGGTRMPSLTEPSETTKNLKQTVLVQQNKQHVFCCSSPLTEPRAKCDCRDFKWDPISRNGSGNVGDPCPPTTMVMTKATHTIPITASSPHDNTSLNVRAIIPTRVQIEEKSSAKKFVNLLIVCCILTLILFFAYAINLARFKLMNWKNNANKGHLSCSNGHEPV